MDMFIHFSNITLNHYTTPVQTFFKLLFAYSVSCTVSTRIFKLSMHKWLQISLALNFPQAYIQSLKM